MDFKLFLWLMIAYFVGMVVGGAMTVWILSPLTKLRHRDRRDLRYWDL